MCGIKLLVGSCSVCIGNVGKRSRWQNIVCKRNCW